MKTEISTDRTAAVELLRKGEIVALGLTQTWFPWHYWRLATDHAAPWSWYLLARDLALFVLAGLLVFGLNGRKMLVRDDGSIVGTMEGVVQKVTPFANKLADVRIRKPSR